MIRKRLCVLILACALPGWLAGCAIRPQTMATPTPWPTPMISEKPTYLVQRGTVIDRFTLRGQVGPAQWQELSFKVDGRLAGLSVAPGSDVKAGDLLAELETETLDEQLAQARVSLEQAEAQLKEQTESQSFVLERLRLQLRVQELTLQKLRDAQQLNRPLQLAQAAAEFERAKTTLERARSAYDAVAWRSDVGMTSQAAALQAATLDYEVAEARYKLQSGGDGKTEIAIQEVQVQLAELAVKESESKTDPNLERNVTKARMQTDTLERQIEERRLRAPTAGRVVAVGLKASAMGGFSERPKVGDKITAFAPLVVVAEPGPLEVVVRAEEAGAGQLVVDQPVKIAHSAFGERMLDAKVLALPLGNLGSGNQPSPPQVIRISLPSEAERVSIGDSVQIEVVTQVHEDTLFLPPAAVRRFSGRTFALVQEDGKQRRVDVRLGLQNADQVEILAGLAEGDVVIGQ